MDTNKVIIDWLSFTSKIDSPQTIREMIGMDKVTWQVIKGAQGYRDRLYYDSVSIHYNGREDMGVWCEMSGQGCRAFESVGHGDYQAIFNDVEYHDKEMNITRIDVAYDDFEGLLDIDTIMHYIRSGWYVAPTTDFTIELTNKGTTLYIGSKKSDFLIRIYDKALERGRTDGSHWVRFEMQLRRGRAKKFAFDNLPIGQKYVGVLNNYLRFVDPAEDSNKSRWPVADWWLKFVRDLSRISIYDKPGTDYNEVNLERYVIGQAGNSIDTYIKCFGLDKLIDELKHRPSTLNPKQRSLVAKYIDLED